MYRSYYDTLLMRNSKTVSNFAAILLVSGMLVGCFEKKTDDPIKAYQYWAGEKPNERIEVINGRYWGSAHWSKEYIMYLELKASPLWRAEFIRQNNLKLDTFYAISDDAPSWFKPIGSYKIWRPSGFDQGSVYFEDTVEGHLFIYDIQL
jgi:hypothetical protein